MEFRAIPNSATGILHEGEQHKFKITIFVFCDSRSCAGRLFDLHHAPHIHAVHPYKIHPAGQCLHIHDYLGVMENTSKYRLGKQVGTGI